MSRLDISLQLQEINGEKEMFLRCFLCVPRRDDGAFESQEEHIGCTSCMEELWETEMLGVLVNTFIIIIII